MSKREIAAAAAKKAATTTPRSAALDAAGYAYALVRANDGGAVVTLDLDRTQRVRSAVFFYETRAQADAVRKAVMSARPKAAPLALARVRDARAGDRRIFWLSLNTQITKAKLHRCASGGP